VSNASLNTMLAVELRRIANLIEGSNFRVTVSVQMFDLSDLLRSEIRSICSDESKFDTSVWRDHAWDCVKYHDDRLELLLHHSNEVTA